MFTLRSRIRKCCSCGKYTLSETCQDCGSAAINTFPPRYSPEDRYGKYRRMHYAQNEMED